MHKLAFVFKNLWELCDSNESSTQDQNKTLMNKEKECLQIFLPYVASQEAEKKTH